MIARAADVMTSPSGLIARRWLRAAMQCAAALLAACVTAPAAHPQALPTATGPGMYVNVGGTFSDFESDYGKQAITGAGVYVDSNLYWRYGLESEARRVVYPNFGGRQSTLLGGPRWSFRAKDLVPYVKLLAGGGRFDFPYGYGHGDYFVVAPGAGLDLRLGERLRVRLVDFEYQDWLGFTYGSQHPYGVSAGISFQFLGASRTNLSK
jgi:hypothetical protein